MNLVLILMLAVIAAIVIHMRQTGNSKVEDNIEEEANYLPIFKIFVFLCVFILGVLMIYSLVKSVLNKSTNIDEAIQVAHAVAQEQQELALDEKKRLVELERRRFAAGDMHDDMHDPLKRLARQRLAGGIDKVIRANRTLAAFEASTPPEMRFGMSKGKDSMDLYHLQQHTSQYGKDGVGYYDDGYESGGGGVGYDEPYNAVRDSGSRPRLGTNPQDDGSKHSMMQMLGRAMAERAEKEKMDGTSMGGAKRDERWRRALGAINRGDIGGEHGVRVSNPTLGAGEEDEQKEDECIQGAGHLQTPEGQELDHSFAGLDESAQRMLLAQLISHSPHLVRKVLHAVEGGGEADGGGEGAAENRPGHQLAQQHQAADCEWTALGVPPPPSPRTAGSPTSQPLRLAGPADDEAGGGGDRGVVAMDGRPSSPLGQPVSPQHARVVHLLNQNRSPKGHVFDSFGNADEDTGRQRKSRKTESRKQKKKATKKKPLKQEQRAERQGRQEQQEQQGQQGQQGQLGQQMQEEQQEQQGQQMQEGIEPEVHVEQIETGVGGGGRIANLILEEQRRRQEQQRAPTDQEGTGSTGGGRFLPPVEDPGRQTKPARIII
jgi:hypothetical protein